MNDGELRNVERDLGRLIGLVEAQGREIRVLREEGNRREAAFVAAMSEHDQRDDDRFGAVGRELGLINQALALEKQRSTDEQSEETRRHSWKTALLTGACSIGAGGISVLLTLLLTKGHP